MTRFTLGYPLLASPPHPARPARKPRRLHLPSAIAHGACYTRRRGVHVGQIYHHAQAILIAKWALTTLRSVRRTLCERIVAAQTDEITLLSHCLSDRQQAVPHPDPDT